MKIKLDGIDLVQLNETKQKVIKNEIKEEKFKDDVKRRIVYSVMHKYEQCFKRLKEEWDPKLAKTGLKAIPTDPDAYAELVFSQPTYKNRSDKEKEI